MGRLALVFLILFSSAIGRQIARHQALPKRDQVRKRRLQHSTAALGLERTIVNGAEVLRER